MSTTAIQVQGLGKEYRIGAAKQTRSTETVGEAIRDRIFGARPKKRSADTKAENSFWAIQNIDLSVQTGEVVGIIGRNGSGKSTLLKILSDIVEPTTGRAEIRGRVASLLEVGTGFHGELTGRENIFLNGAILGMDQREIRRNFDQIVEFSGVGKFLDTPVKRYSSGMYVRLAFAVAAHLEPEVLIVDEVLAVGDFEFQQKCLGRMKDVARGGRTVLFVSHNVAAVESLCSRCVLLDSGRVVQDDEPYVVTREYRRRMSQVGTESVALLDDVEGAGRKVRVFSSARIVDDAGEVTTCVPVSRAFEVRLGVRIPEGAKNLLFVVRVDNLYGARMLTLKSPLKNSPHRDLQGEHEISCRVREFPLAPGAYHIGIAVYARDEMIDAINDVLTLTVTEGEIFGEGHGAVGGMCVARTEWGLEPLHMDVAGLAAGNA